MAKKKKDPYENLHGKELVDAIMRDNTLGTIATERQQRENERMVRELDRKIARNEEIKSKIADFLRPIFFTPLSIFFHIVTFAFRIIGGISCVTMFYGIYCAYKAFIAWRAGEIFGNYVQTAVMLIVFPFIAFAIATIAGKAWVYFEDNKY